MNNICRIFAATGTCHYGSRCRFLHILPGAGPSRMASSSYAEHSSIPEPRPHDRVWIENPNPTTSETTPSPAADNRGTFRLVSYNILADALAYEHAPRLYPRAPQWCLKWPHRRDTIVKELLFYEPDIICLQEVDHFEDLRTALQPHGFSGVHLQRTGDRTDGCATFWRSSRFRRTDIHNLRLNAFDLKDNVALLVLLEPLLPAAACPPPPPAASDRQQGEAEGTRPAGSCGESAGGEASTSGGGGGGGGGDDGRAAGGPKVLVGNTHILFNTKRGDVKLGQLRTILGTMAAIAQREAAVEGSPGVVSLLGGDFNLVPSSSLYSFIASGSLSVQGLDRRDLSGQQEGFNYTNFLRGYNPSTPHLGPPPPRQPRQSSHHRPHYSHHRHHHPHLNSWTPEELTLALGTPQPPHNPPGGQYPRAPETPMLASHPLKLLSTYHTAAGHEPSFTTCHHAYMGTVDFIWYTPQGEGGGEGGCALRPVRVLAPPDPRGFPRGMPSPGWPSDHVAMVCDYELL